MAGRSEDDETDVREVLERWAETTRRGELDRVLDRHLPSVLIYDVLAPLRYEGAQAYRDSWGDWQPDTQGEGVFQLEDLIVTAGDDVAFAHGLIRCGGTMPDGRSFEDLVRATFCLTRTSGSWMVAHQHISKPVQTGG